MATYIDRTNDAINEIAGGFWTQVRDTATLDHEIAEELFKAGQDYRDEKLIEQKRQAKLYAMKMEAAGKIEKALDNLKDAYTKDKAVLDRAVLRASTGERIAEQYAKDHNISIDQARHELKEYAETKRSSFGDGLPDQYAAIRNKGTELSRDDMHKAHEYYNAELKAGGYYEKEQLVKKAEYMANRTGLATLDEWNTSGAAITRQLYQNK